MEKKNKNSDKSKDDLDLTQLKKDAERFVSLLINKCLFFLPKVIKKLLIITVLVAFIIFGWVNTYVGIVRILSPNNQSGGQVLDKNTNQPYFGPVESCVDSDFQNKNLWENFTKFNIISENPLTVSLKDGSPGNVAFCRQVFSGQFAASYSFIPLNSDKANAVFQYDSLFRVIVGENNLKAVSVERNQSYLSVPGDWKKIPDLERHTTQRFIGGDGFKPNNKVTIKIIGIPQSNNNLHLTVEITYAPPVNQLGGADQTARYEYDVKTPIDAYDLQGKLGVGILGSNSIKIQPLHLKVEEYNLQP